MEKAEAAFFKRLDREQQDKESGHTGYDASDKAKAGKRFTYRPSQIRWREIWMPFAATILLALALGVAAYKTGVKRGTDVASTLPHPAKESEGSIEEQASDAGHERAQLMARIGENAKVIDDLKHQLSEQIKIVNSLKSMATATRSNSGSGQENGGGIEQCHEGRRVGDCTRKISRASKDNGSRGSTA